MKQELARCNAKDRPELRERQALFATEQPIYFYFEVYNLARDADEETAYEVEAALTPWDDGQYLILDAQGQPPGRYVLSLRVRDSVTGEWVEASREVFLE